MNQEDWLPLFKWQQKYDQHLFSAFDENYQSLLKDNRIFRAILDELGEWNHTYKPVWGWWQKKKKGMERQRQLEEYADILHFVISYCIAISGGIPKLPDTPMPETASGEDDFIDAVMKLMAWSDARRALKDPEEAVKNLLESMLALAANARISKEEILSSFFEKGETNEKRITQGY